MFLRNTSPKAACGKCKNCEKLLCIRKIVFDGEMRQRHNLIFFTGVNLELAPRETKNSSFTLPARPFVFTFVFSRFEAQTAAYVNPRMFCLCLEVTKYRSKATEARAELQVFPQLELPLHAELLLAWLSGRLPSPEEKLVQIRSRAASNLAQLGEGNRKQGDL